MGKLPISEKPYSEATSKRFVKAIMKLKVEGVIKTKVQLAGAMGIDDVTILNIEKGRRSITIDAACKFCELYDIDPSWLFLGKGTMRKLKKSSDIMETIKNLKETISSLEDQYLSSQKAGQKAGQAKNQPESE